MQADSCQQPLHNIQFVRYSLTFAAKPTRAIHPQYDRMFIGANWRDVYGKVLRTHVCETRMASCEGCSLQRHCVYFRLYEENPATANHILGQRRDAARPYLFHVVQLESNDTIDRVRVDLTLIGAISRHSTVFIESLIETAAIHKWKLPNTYTVERIMAQSGDATAVCVDKIEVPIASGYVKQLPACPEVLTVLLESPLSIRRKNAMVRAHQLTFRTFFASLLRQISGFCAHHGTPLDDRDFRDLVASCDAIRRSDSSVMKNVEYVRYAIGKKRPMPVRGIQGVVRFEGHDLSEYWPYIWLGQWLHLGKLTSMGCGHYRVLT